MTLHVAATLCFLVAQLLGTRQATPVPDPSAGKPFPSTTISGPLPPAEQSRSFESLYTTVIQVSATIVAIVGGFLTTFALTHAEGLGRVIEFYRRTREATNELGKATDMTKVRLNEIDEERSIGIRTLLSSRDSFDILIDRAEDMDKGYRKRAEELLENMDQKVAGMDQAMIDAVVAGQGDRILEGESRLAPIGLAALLPLTLFGIVMPLIFLAYDDFTPPPWHRTATLIGFLTGLVIVALYISLAVLVLPLIRRWELNEMFKPVEKGGKSDETG